MSLPIPRCQYLSGIAGAGRTFPDVLVSLGGKDDVLYSNTGSLQVLTLSSPPFPPAPIGGGGVHMIDD